MFHKIPRGCGDVNKSYTWWWKPFSISVSSKKALKGLLIWCSLQMTFALCKFSVKKSDSPWTWSRQLPRPTVPLRQAAFVFKCSKELKVGSFGWHVSRWLGALIANIRGGCQVGGVFVCTSWEERLLALLGCCFDRRALNTSHFWESFLEMCGRRTEWLTHIHMWCVCLLVCWHILTFIMCPRLYCW